MAINQAKTELSTQEWLEAYGLTKDQLMEALRRMHLIRFFEELYLRQLEDAVEFDH